jgi:hypothetical protein|tara:strand:- start:7652 stop:7849 length:198 start_codon:yes stop_codon:yes gene_type:complete
LGWRNRLALRRGKGKGGGGQPDSFRKAYRSVLLYLLLSKTVARNERMIQVFDRGMERLNKMGGLE